VQVEDIILRVNGTSVSETADFDKVMDNFRANRVRLDVYRPSTGQRGYINVDVDPNARTAD
jgi:C-terminal processing protease CtpA/Prc